MMRKVLLMIMVFSFTLMAVACGAPAAKQADKPADEPAAQTKPVDAKDTEPEPANEPKIIVFTDAALEAKVRKAMSKPEGDITLAEVEAVTKLDLSNESFDDMNSHNGGIRDISDLEYFTGLKDLNLSYNDISDFSPLAELKSIETLGFTGIRPKDLSVLQGLTNMTCLIFDWTWN